MDGFSVTIFAYGQTGSGKTHTMEGSPGQPGLCYRTFDELFAIQEDRRGRSTYQFTVSMLEIYNEQVRDLLNSDGNKKKLDIRVTPTGSEVPGLIVQEVHSAIEVRQLMETGNQNRAVSRAFESRLSPEQLTVHERVPTSIDV